MPTYQMTAAYQFSSQTEADRALFAKAVTGYRNLVQDLLERGGFELHLSSRDGKADVRITPYAPTVDLAVLLGEGDRFLDLSQTPDPGACICTSPARDDVERTGITRVVRLIPTGSLRHTTPVPLPVDARRPRDLERVLDMIAQHPRWGFLDLVTGSLQELVLQTAAPRDSYLVAVPHPIEARLRARSWTATLRHLSRRDGCVRLRCVKPNIRTGDRDYAQSGIGHYLISRTRDQVYDPGLNLLLAVMKGGPVANVAIEVLGAPGLAAAVCADLDPEALRPASPGEALGAVRLPPREMLAYTSWYLPEEAAELMLPPFSPLDALPGLPAVTATPMARPQLRPPAGTPVIHLGDLVRPRDGRRLTTALSRLTEHVVVTGQAGSGKTNTLRHLLDQLVTQGIPTTVIDPANRALGAAVTELGGTVWDFSDRPGSVFRLNPFMPPDDVPVYEHIALLTGVLAMTFRVTELGESMLHNMVVQLYREKTESTRTSDLLAVTGTTLRKTPGRIPTMDDLIAAWHREHRPRLLGDNTWSAATVAFFDERWRALESSLLKDVTTPVDPALGIGTLLSGTHLLELRALGNEEEINALMLLVFGMLASAMRHRPVLSRPTLRHALLIDEAHRIAGPVGPPRAVDTAPSSAGNRLADLVTAMAKQCRQTGLGLVLAEQSIGDLNESVLTNTATTIVHRVIDGADRQEIARRFGLEPATLRAVSALEDGHALVKTVEIDTPTFIHVPHRAIGEQTQ
ncbi:ATP-binding protein [Kitasatospora sp. NPDC127111]|uniref:ATP-binding protein n=1 Tax=Kitasatospora sp. NPDC127111 TaxID=3345363 RepID=UPI00363E07C8